MISIFSICTEHGASLLHVFFSFFSLSFFFFFSFSQFSLFAFLVFCFLGFSVSRY